MPRKPREEEAGAVHHVFSRGNGKQQIFFNDDDLLEYLDRLARVVGRCGWRCMSYCLMSNHMHLLIETPEPNLGVGMQWFHGRYAQDFNRRWARSGHLFQGRYGNVRVKSDDQFRVLARYIAMNPVVAGLCDRPEDFAWASHRSVVADDAPGWLDAARMLEFFGANGGDPLERYLEYVTPPSPVPAPTSPPR